MEDGSAKAWRLEVKNKLDRLEEHIAESPKKFPDINLNYSKGEVKTLKEILDKEPICENDLTVMESNYKKIMEKYEKERPPGWLNFYAFNAGSLAAVRFVQKKANLVAYGNLIIF